MACIMHRNILPRHPLFTIRTEFLSVDERVLLSYQRAKLVMQTYGASNVSYVSCLPYPHTFPAALSASDIEHCSDKYWSMMTDPILSLDAAMVTILLVHVGLTIGTLARHLHRRPDLEPLVDCLLRFDTVGIYLLTERGHGLDAFNVETTATKTSQGFIINTPREEASKSVHPVIQFS